MCLVVLDPSLHPGPRRAPHLAQVVTSEERRPLSRQQNVAAETSAGQIEAEGSFRVADDPEVTRAYASTTITTTLGISDTSAFLKPRLLFLP